MRRKSSRKRHAACSHASVAGGVQGNGRGGGGTGDGRREPTVDESRKETTRRVAKYQPDRLPWYILHTASTENLSMLLVLIESVCVLPIVSKFDDMALRRLFCLLHTRYQCSSFVATKLVPDTYLSGIKESAWILLKNRIVLLNVDG